MTSNRLATMSALCTLLLSAGCGDKGPKEIQFMQYGEGYSAKPDFALVEHKYPLSPKLRSELNPKYLAGLDQEQVDQIYARLTAGPIPNGAFDGNLFFPKGISGERRIAEIVGGLKGFVVNLKGRKVELLGRALWKGKVFYRDQRVLRNRIEDLVLLAPLVDGPLRDVPKIEVNGKDAWLLFPAKLYCGQSLLDSRRESIVIDYAFTDEIEGYREKPDFLAGRRGLKIRDEIRMVRPGFYLGRAYADRAFLLNFTLYNAEIAERDGKGFAQTGAIAEDCWPGTQRAVVASN